MASAAEALRELRRWVRISDLPDATDPSSVVWLSHQEGDPPSLVPIDTAIEVLRYVAGCCPKTWVEAAQTANAFLDDLWMQDPGTSLPAWTYGSRNGIGAVCYGNPVVWEYAMGHEVLRCAAMVGILGSTGRLRTNVLLSLLTAPYEDVFAPAIIAKDSDTAASSFALCLEARPLVYEMATWLGCVWDAQIKAPIALGATHRPQYVHESVPHDTQRATVPYRNAKRVLAEVLALRLPPIHTCDCTRKLVSAHPDTSAEWRGPGPQSHAPNTCGWIARRRKYLTAPDAIAGLARHGVGSCHPVWWYPDRGCARNAMSLDVAVDRPLRYGAPRCASYFIPTKHQWWLDVLFGASAMCRELEAHLDRTDDKGVVQAT